MSNSSDNNPWGCGGCVVGLVGLVASLWVITHPIVFVTGIWHFISNLFS